VSRHWSSRSARYACYPGRRLAQSQLPGLGPPAGRWPRLWQSQLPAHCRWPAPVLWAPLLEERVGPERLHGKIRQENSVLRILMSHSRSTFLVLLTTSSPRDLPFQGNGTPTTRLWHQVARQLRWLALMPILVCNIIRSTHWIMGASRPL
jgi:hypothetical protein